jgi:hypothetical protein
VKKDQAMKKSITARVVITFMIMALSGCATAQHNQNINKQIIADLMSYEDDYNVYAVLLDEFFPGRAPVVIYDVSFTDYEGNRKMMDRVLANARKQMPLLSVEITDDFLFKSNEPKRHEIKLFPDERSVSFFNYEQKMEIQNNPNIWKKFQDKFPLPRPYVTLSRVAYDADATLAFVYISSQKAAHDAFGEYVLLTKEDGTWRVLNRFAAWFS